MRTYEARFPLKWLAGAEYGPLMSNGAQYLCPDCGGYGTYNDKACGLCKKSPTGAGFISLSDPRVTDNQPKSIVHSFADSVRNTK